MQTNISTCDHCKNSATTKEEKDKQNILRVAVGVWEPRYSSYSVDKFTPKNALHCVEWCKTCREIHGLFYQREDAPAHATLPTIEDLIREIAAEAAQQAVNN